MTTSITDTTVATLDQPAPPAGAATPNEAMTPRVALADLTRPVAVLLRVGQLLGALSGVLAVVPYIVLVQLGDLLIAAAAANQTPDVAKVEGIIALLLGTFLTRLFLYFLALLCTHIADVRLNRSLRERVLATIGRAPLSWFSERTSGLVRKSLQDDVSALHILVAHKPVDYAVAATMPVALIGYAFFLNWQLGLLSIALVVAYLGGNMWMMRGMHEKTLQLDRRLEQLSGTVVEFLSGINVVKAFGTVGKAHSRFTAQATEVNDFYYDWCKPMLSGSALAAAIVSAPMMLLVSFGGGAWLVAVGQATPAQVVAVSLISLMLPNSVESVSNQQWFKQIAGAAAVRIKTLIDGERLESPPTSRAVPQGHSVQLEHVTFAYGDTVALQDVSVDLPEGSITALVGPSGSGKSTLATLVARFHDPDAGVVRIGGVDVRDLSERDLFERVAFVLQRPELLAASVRENIALARPDASDEDVHAAARAAHIHDEIEALPRGYDTVLGHDTSLSGGQEQRVAIARAILANRPILLLDEATALTDPDCEAEIQRALSNLVVGKTVLVIAHRPASVRGVDRVLVMDAGRIIAQGTHHELIDEPHYRAIWHAASAEPIKEQA